MNRPSTILGALLLATMCASTAHADSGVICHDDCTPTLVSGTGPTRTDTLVSTWRFTIENVNDVCNEDTKVSIKAFSNDPLRQKSGLGTQGRAELIGLYKPGSAPSPNPIEWNFEDETTQQIHFDVETGEDVNGCDFEGFSLQVLVCDTGGGCDIFPDGPCETPTLYTTSFEVESPDVAQVVGDSVIKGEVTRTLAGNTVPANATLTILKSTGCLHGEEDDATPFAQAMLDTEPAWKPTGGQYSLGALPAGEYRVTARVDGSKQTQTIVVAAHTTVTVNFAF